jgi:citrate lyase subunit beta/citryl-CoA lyase
MLTAFESAVKRGLGAVSFEGKMLDKPIAERARRVLQHAGKRKDA